MALRREWPQSPRRGSRRWRFPRRAIAYAPHSWRLNHRTPDHDARVAPITVEILRKPVVDDDAPIIIWRRRVHEMHHAHLIPVRHAHVRRRDQPILARGHANDIAVLK